MKIPKHVIFILVAILLTGCRTVTEEDEAVFRYNYNAIRKHTGDFRTHYICKLNNSTNIDYNNI